MPIKSINSILIFNTTRFLYDQKYFFMFLQIVAITLIYTLKILVLWSPKAPVVTVAWMTAGKPYGKILILKSGRNLILLVMDIKSYLCMSEQGTWISGSMNGKRYVLVDVSSDLSQMLILRWMKPLEKSCLFDELPKGIWLSWLGCLISTCSKMKKKWSLKIKIN